MTGPLSLGSLMLLFSASPPAAEPTRAILIGDCADPEELLAARELQRYCFQLSGETLEIRTCSDKTSRPRFILGQPRTHSLIHGLAQQGRIRISAQDPGPQGYALKTISDAGEACIVIAGADAIGCLYGVYGLLGDHFGIGFYLGGDVMPDVKRPLVLPPLDESKTPAVPVRGFLPWTNFPQSATSYSWDDWRFVIDQMAKMRMNLLHIHNYNGHFDANEPFHNFTLDGFTSRAWFATAMTGHRWGGEPGWDPNRYLFGAADLFDDYDFGADCTLHNETMTNIESFRKAVSLFQRIINYAHTRGVRIALGIELDVIPVYYGVQAEDPRVVAARVEQIATDYPDLDYLLCYQTEIIRERKDGYRIWRSVLDQVYREMKRRSPRTRLGVSGWGLSAEDVARLPPDIICAPIASYSATCESGATYGEREYWGCPWLERDGYSSAYYYPYNVHLSDTMAAWGGRAPNMKGFTCLTWRLTDAIDPKIGYIAKAPWDTTGKYRTSRDVYHEYAELHYGHTVADAITEIINQNEAIGNDFWGECMPTPPFRVREETQPSCRAKVTSVALADEAGGIPLAVEASQASDRQSAQNAVCHDGGDCVGFATSGDWLGFGGLDFGLTPRTKAAIRVASTVDVARLELRLGAANGLLLGQVDVPNTGDWESWQTVETAITPTSGRQDLYVRLAVRGIGCSEHEKATGQLAAIDNAIGRTQSAAQCERLKLLRCRIQSARDHIELDRDFELYGWSDLPGAMESWMRNICQRVTDISSLGNVVSSQNRFVQLNYCRREQELRARLPVRPGRPESYRIQPPGTLNARGTRTGALLTWRHEQPGVRGFFVYRDGERLNAQPLPPASDRFEDEATGDFRYTVCALGWDDQESWASIPAGCLAGAADRESPRIVVVSPPASGVVGEAVWVKARVLDNRGYDCISATVCYREPGQRRWRELPMTRRVKAIFAAVLPRKAVGERGLEYFIEASDGDNTSVFPVQGAAMPLSLVATNVAGNAPGMPRGVSVVGRILGWQASKGEVCWYRIYRCDRRDFAPGPDNYLTFVAAGTTRFEDGGLGLDGKPLTGEWHYRITAVSPAGKEGRPSRSLGVWFSD